MRCLDVQPPTLPPLLNTLNSYSHSHLGKSFDTTLEHFLGVPTLMAGHASCVTCPIANIVSARTRRMATAMALSARLALVPPSRSSSPCPRRHHRLQRQWACRTVANANGVAPGTPVSDGGLKLTSVRPMRAADHVAVMVILSEAANGKVGRCRSTPQADPGLTMTALGLSAGS